MLNLFMEITTPPGIGSEAEMNHIPEWYRRYSEKLRQEKTLCADAKQGLRLPAGSARSRSKYCQLLDLIIHFAIIKISLRKRPSYSSSVLGAFSLLTL